VFANVVLDPSLPLAARFRRPAILPQKDKIHLIHEYRTDLPNRMFDELCHKTDLSTEQVLGLHLIVVSLFGRCNAVAARRYPVVGFDLTLPARGALSTASPHEQVEPAGLARNVPPC
jgi:hypothetical protein